MSVRRIGCLLALIVLAIVVRCCVGCGPEPLRVGTLARLSRLSPSQFQRAFRKAYDTTPVRKINEFRIEEAREYLEDPSRDIAAIARETGFASASFFSTQFKRFTGLTPREYRKSVSGNGGGR